MKHRPALIAPAAAIRACLAVLVLGAVSIGLLTIAWLRHTEARMGAIENRAQRYHLATIGRTASIRGNLAELRTALVQHELSSRANPERLAAIDEELLHNITQISSLIATECNAIMLIQEKNTNAECNEIAQQFSAAYESFKQTVLAAEQSRNVDVSLLAARMGPLAIKTDQLNRTHGVHYDEIVAAIPTVQAENYGDFRSFVVIIICVSAAAIGGSLYFIEKVLAKRLESEARARDRERRLRDIADALPTVVAYLDVDERYGFLNAAYERWFERPIAQVLGTRIEDDLGIRAYEQIRPGIQRALSGSPANLEAVYYSITKGKRIINPAFIPHFNDDGAVVGVFALITDLTERKRIEQELVEAKQMAAEASRRLEAQRGISGQGTDDRHGRRE